MSLKEKREDGLHTLLEASCPDSSETIDSAGESMMTDVNWAEDIVIDVGAEEVVVFELCAERAGVGRYTLLSCRKGTRRAAAGGVLGAAIMVW